MRTHHLANCRSLLQIVKSETEKRPKHKKYITQDYPTWQKIVYLRSQAAKTQIIGTKEHSSFGSLLIPFSSQSSSQSSPPTVALPRPMSIALSMPLHGHILPPFQPSVPPENHLLSHPTLLVMLTPASGTHKVPTSTTAPWMTSPFDHWRGADHRWGRAN